MRDLTQLRTEIDRIDDQIIDLLAQRFAFCHEVARYKQRHNIAVVLPERIEQVKSRCAARALSQSLDADFVRDIYTRIIDQTCETEYRVLAESERSDTNSP